MHALITDKAVIQYPYSINELRRDNPGVSFPSSPSDELLAYFDVQRIFFTLAPSTLAGEVCEESLPAFNDKDDRWVQVWTVRDLTPDELASQNLLLGSEIRAQRNALLAGCDWIVIKAIESGASVPSQWAAYRQDLRDISGQENFPITVVWPIAP